MQGERISVRLKENEKRLLRATALATGSTVSELVRRALEAVGLLKPPPFLETNQRQTEASDAGQQD